MPETPLAAMETLATLFLLFLMHLLSTTAQCHTSRYSYSKKWHVLKTYATTGLQFAQNQWSGHRPRTVFPRPRAAAKCFRLNASESTWQKQWKQQLNMGKHYHRTNLIKHAYVAFSWRTTACREISKENKPLHTSRTPFQWTLNWTYLSLSHYPIVSWQSHADVPCAVHPTPGVVRVLTRPTQAEELIYPGEGCQLMYRKFDVGKDNKKITANQLHMCIRYIISTLSICFWNCAMAVSLDLLSSEDSNPFRKRT